MKKYAGVLKKVRQTDNRRRGTFDTTDSNLYKGMKTFYALAFIYTMCINALYIMGMFLEITGADSAENQAWLDVLIILLFPTALIASCVLWLKFKKHLIAGIVGVVPIIFGMIIALVKSKAPSGNVDYKGLIIVSVATALIIAGLVVYEYKQYLVAGIISFVPEAYLFYMFADILKDDFGGLLGLQYKFYFRHGIPLAIMAICIVLMTTIACIEEFKLNKAYKKVTEDLYEKFCAEHGDEETVSEEEWTEYLKNYDPGKEGKNKPIKEKIFKD